MQLNIRKNVCRISSNKPRVSNEHHPLISAAALSMFIELSAAL